MIGSAQTQLPSLAGAAWLASAETQAVFQALADAGHEARAVGGIVRNALLGLPVTDIDIATPAHPEAVVAAAQAAGLGVAATGLDHGTVTVIANHVPYEVTTLRRDVTTDGRRATVAFTTDWIEDARRRDFTMNALYCDRHGVVHDPLGGYPDLDLRRVRFIGDADQRIAEDYLRILRFFRFHAVLGEGPLDPEGLAACIRGRRGLGRLSAERVRSELLRLLTGKRAAEAIAAMTDCGLLASILRGAPRPGVFKALITAEASVGAMPDAVLRLSALAIAVEEDIPAIAELLRLSNDERNALLAMDLQLAERFAFRDEAEATRVLYRLGPARWRASILGALAVANVAGTALGATAATSSRDHVRALYTLPERWAAPRFPVKGADILALGIAAGPEVGRILAVLEQWWIDAGFPPEPAVRHHLQTLIDGRSTQ